jgi:integrase
MRRGEAATLHWKDVDLDHETTSLGENETNHARWWRLASGVADALRA